MIYEEMLATVFGLFGVTDMRLAGRITLEEYRIRKRGHLMKQLEREREIYLQAYVTRVVKATDKKGNYVYQEFKDFYDEDKRRNEVLGKQTRVTTVNQKLIAIAKRMQKYSKKGGY